MPTILDHVTTRSLDANLTKAILIRREQAASRNVREYRKHIKVLYQLARDPELLSEAQKTWSIKRKTQQTFKTLVARQKALEVQILAIQILTITLETPSKPDEFGP
ncbi:hypothetical protein XPA_010728 [Xanthoria parietina]